MLSSYSVRCPNCSTLVDASNPKPEEVVTSVKAVLLGDGDVSFAFSLGLSSLWSATVELSCPTCDARFEAKFGYRIS